MGEITTIAVSRETKQMLEEMKTGSFDETIKRLIKNQNQFPREIRSLTKTVPPSSRITREENRLVFDEDVRIITVYIFFPPGCEDLVEIVMGAGSHVFAPNVISGDGKVVSFSPNLFVGAKTPIWAEITNYDQTYPHTPTIEVEVERIREVGVV